MEGSKDGLKYTARKRTKEGFVYIDGEGGETFSKDRIAKFDIEKEAYDSLQKTLRNDVDPNRTDWETVPYTELNN